MTVLATVDFTDHSATVIRTSIQFADLYRSDLDVLHCRPGAADSWIGTHQFNGSVDPSTLAERKRLQNFVEEIGRSEITRRRVRYHYEPPPVDDAIPRLEETESLRLVVAGAPHRGRLARFLTESTPESLVRKCDTPVLVLPSSPDPSPISAPILAPLDPDRRHRQSMEMAIGLARKADVPLIVLSADATEHTVERALLAFDLRGVDYRIETRAESELESIRHELDEDDCGLVVLGRPDEVSFTQLLLGTPADRIIRELPCAVLVVPERDELAAIALPAFERALG